MSLPGPLSGFCDIGVIEEGDVDVEQFRHIMENSKYMMNLGNDDAEIEAIGSFKPIWKLLDIYDDTWSRTSAKQKFKGLLQRARINKKLNVGKTPTHTDMTGASFYIPEVSSDPKYPNDTDETFLKLYSAVIVEGGWTWLIERYTPTFRFFMDLDFKQPEVIPPMKIEAIAFVVSQTIHKFFPSLNHEYFRLICCTTSYKTETCSACECACKMDKQCVQCHGLGATGKSKDSTKNCDKCMGISPIKKKTGVHLIWPNLYVTDDQCLDIRESVISDLIKTFGHRNAPFNNWTDVVDAAVYKKSGLRMIGARKSEKCSVCHGKRKLNDEDCIKCRGLGNEDKKRPYGPLFVTNGKGRRDLEKETEYRANYYKLVLDAKIRYFGEKTEGYVLPDGAPTFETEKKHYDKEYQYKQKGGRVIPNTAEVQAIQQFFATTCATLQPKYAEIIVTSVVKSAKSYIVNVSGQGCTYCQNVGRTHRSNRIYFVVVQEGVMQRCHDDADTITPDMKYGLCKDFKSALMPLPSKIQSLLFFVESASILGEHEKDRKLHSLLDAGNKLCRDLFNTDWTSSSRFAASHGEKLLQVEKSFRSFLPDSLSGFQDENTVLSSLGFVVEDDDEDESIPEVLTVQDKLLKETPTLSELKENITRELQGIVSAALNDENEDWVIEMLQKGFSFLDKRVKKRRFELVLED